MQKQYQPIKRSRQLATLSREHHEDLLFVWKIKQGIAFDIPAKRIANYCEWFWENKLKDHFSKEEHALGTLLPVDDHLINTMMEDHQAITRKMEEVINDASYFSLQRLSQILYHHIRFEERNLFTHIQQVVPTDKLNEAAAILETTPKKKAIWQDEFWVRSPQTAVQKNVTLGHDEVR